ncbi:hypothetical protein DOE76_06285 [Leifsonia sp. ku-ls]|nr:hypothetical protein DOE76_06285 [Leifsonia sp. ku-ls]
MSTTEFTPERSAAIRQLLIDTVEAEPRRRKRLQILLTSVLSGVAVALAGGTAALALTGVLHFGGGDIPPAPLPTPTPTQTPTPTPTPTPTSTATPLVQTGVVLPNDVDRLAPSTRWSLDLPGSSDCTGSKGYTLSEGRAVYISGVRPKEYEGVPGTEGCGDRRDEHLGLTLVDTSNGTVLWSREWRFTPPTPTYQVGFDVLGTSGRALLVYPGAESGPHDVIDLSTGTSVASVPLDWFGTTPKNDIQALPGPSGDVLLLTRKLDARGLIIGTDTFTRVNPMDVANPVWTASVPTVNTVIDTPTPDAQVVVAKGSDLAYQHSVSTMIRLDTGSTTPLPSESVTSMSRILLGQPSSLSPGDVEITGYALDGSVAWTKQVPSDSQIFPANAPGTQLFGTPDTGEFFIQTKDSLALFDQATGAQRWSVPGSTCRVETAGYGIATLAVPDDAFMFSTSSGRCELTHSTGSVVTGPSDIPSRGADLFGLTNLYTFGSADGTVPAAAYSLSTGERLWTLDQTVWPFLSFDGGYLVNGANNHIESIG